MTERRGIQCGRWRSLVTDVIAASTFQLRRTRTAAHSHASPGLAIGLSGRVSIHFGDHCVRHLEGGALLPIPAGVDHHEQVGEQPAACILLSIPAALQGNLFPCLVHEPTIRELAPLLAEAVEYEDGPRLEALSAELLAWSRLLASGPEVPEPSPSWIGVVRTLIDGGYREPVTLGWLAHEVGVSREHLARQFRQATGLTVGQYLRGRRLVEGAAWLRRTPMELSEVAVQCGFADQSHFTREFRKQFRVTPRCYRSAVRRAGRGA